MGNSSSQSISGGVSGEIGSHTDRGPLLFHDVHSDHVRLFNNKRVAKRVESFCKGICFSRRPVAVGERVYLKVVEISTNWSGFLRVGFTSIDPANQQAALLPRYACPDMTNMPGNWAKALPERYGVENNVICFYVNRSGEVHISINGQDVPGLFFNGVNTSVPLWVLVDIYGNATGAEFVDKLQVFHRTGASLTPVIPVQSTTSVIPDNSPVKYHIRNVFEPLMFHAKSGKSVNVSSDRLLATRHGAEYSNAYVFTCRPVKLSEKIVIQIQGLDFAFKGGLTVGMTACDPAGLRQQDLPDDSDLLLDRPEYWVVHKDVYTGAECGDELSFTLSNEGEVHFGKNGYHISVIMHVDKTIPLWLFLDLYGQFSKVKMLGVVGAARPVRRMNQPTVPGVSTRTSPMPRSVSMSESGGTSESLTVELPPRLETGASAAPPVPPRLQKSFSCGPSVSPRSCSPPPVTHDTIVETIDSRSPETLSMPSECTVCFERDCDSVIYTCGHMCMCYECALSVQASHDPLCPICRQSIKDVIKIFRP